MAQVNPRDLKPGQWVDGWRIVRRIGSGAYGVVYEVEKDGQRFALKLACHREQSGDPRQTDARAKREVACLQQLHHRHVIRMWAHGRWPEPRSGFLYIVLDFVDGYTLGHWVERTHPTPHEVAVLFLKLFDALEHLHGRGVFHRDLSLRNIMVSQDGEPVIIDFGSADYAAAEELTDAPLPPGTPRNRSPEAVSFWNANRHNPEARYPFKATDDIFALGANLYDVLTDPSPERSKKRPPLGGVMPPPSPFKVTQGRVPQELSAHAMHLIASDPKARPAIAKDARRPLEEFVQFKGPEWRGLPVHPVVSQIPPEPADRASMPSSAGEAARNMLRPGWRRSALAGALALVVLAAVMATSLAQLVPGEPPPPLPEPAEKPTSRSAPLPSPLPPPEEASPSVNQPENSPALTNGVPNPSQVQKASAQRVLSKVQRCALLVASLSWFAAGCPGVQTRPEPEACPEKAIKAMEQELGWTLDSGQTALVTVDVTKGRMPRWPHNNKEEDNWAVFKEGPVTGALSMPYKKAPEGTLLEGHLWTTGDKIVGRYFRARLPNERTVPICLELRHGGMLKEEGSKPGKAVGSKEADAVAVTRWR
ncbi:serine/threonine-protein kinase [Stigmatella sp. ncwal1]|uniref:non-specific serine/threonine protein kinase n=1 Tax=Stigmatella ashevillensis TaxID=2995309 RepID=A0ABT5DAH4_9BACT|nr:serine/threonine-protein kinase [Stigmatella ashevillena]MDC0709352.1 serine/threonine-protein kinase [Stigmatella ashevillena]